MKSGTNDLNCSSFTERLDAVNVEGALVSMGALYCHRSDLQKVLDRKAEYLVGLKGNQPN